MKIPIFLTLQDVIEIHKHQIEIYGGSYGLRDVRLLDSALHAPPAGIGEVYFHPTLFHMGAAYAFHITANHPFIDGNKRTALASALVFLALNGIKVRDPKERLYSAMMKLTTGTMTKEEFSELLRSLSTA